MFRQIADLPIRRWRSAWRLASTARWIARKCMPSPNCHPCHHRNQPPRLPCCQRSRLRCRNDHLEQRRLQLAWLLRPRSPPISRRRTPRRIGLHIVLSPSPHDRRGARDGNRVTEPVPCRPVAGSQLSHLVPGSGGLLKEVRRPGSTAAAASHDRRGARDGNRAAELITCRSVAGGQLGDLPPCPIVLLENVRRARITTLVVIITAPHDHRGPEIETAPPK